MQMKDLNYTGAEDAGNYENYAIRQNYEEDTVQNISKLKK